MRRVTVAALSAASLVVGVGSGTAQEIQELPPITVTTEATMPKPKKTKSTAQKGSPTALPASGQTSGNPVSASVDLLDARHDDIGAAKSGSEGFVPANQLLAKPAYRVGDMLKSVPGLVVTQHSGEGKANQYFLRGFNLDHGTDIAITMDGMPVNMRTHGHGQGYADTNFMIPELMRGLALPQGSLLRVRRRLRLGRRHLSRRR